jgi:hypothetical protein
MVVRSIHPRSMEVSTALSKYYMPRFITPVEVISVLNNAGLKFMLVGLHGICGWMDKPRATSDVDVLVASRHQSKAIKVLLTAFPNLKAEHHDVVTRLRDRETGKVAIDVLKPNQQLYRDALKHTVEQTTEGQKYCIPTLEMSLAMKFATMVSPHREDADKYQDAHDFMRMVKVNESIDMDTLAKLGDLVYPEGGKELVEKVRQVRAGEKLLL